MARSEGVFASAIEVIGETPLVDLSRMTRELDGRILAKLEVLNPGFSKKDRIVRQMVEDAEIEGCLKPGQTAVEVEPSLNAVDRAREELLASVRNRIGCRFGFGIFMVSGESHVSSKTANLSPILATIRGNCPREI